MKYLLKNACFKFLTTLFVIIISLTSASGQGTNNIHADSSLSGTSVVLFFAFLLFVIIAPAFKSSHKLTAK